VITMAAKSSSDYSKFDNIVDSDDEAPAPAAGGGGSSAYTDQQRAAFADAAARNSSAPVDNNPRSEIERLAGRVV